MQIIQTVSENTIYVGASDRRLAKFENLFPIPRGVSYNAYVILDEKPPYWTPPMPALAHSSWRTLPPPWMAASWTI